VRGERGPGPPEIWGGDGQGARAFLFSQKNQILRLLKVLGRERFLRAFGHLS